MDQLIPVASKLQDVLGALGQTTALNLPQIVVVGGQSSGKSSVLEALVGRSFLPRGNGIVTRRPLILQLHNTRAPGMADDDVNENDPKYQNEMTNDSEWGEFNHIKNRKFYDFNQVRDEIIKETDRITGMNRGIDPSPIYLKVYSTRVLALTLVDLPGITKNPVGDQPEDIEDQIRQMSLQYISNPNAIILAVTSANTDLANSDALALAQSVDPYGNRTVGVLTKLDLMDEGTDASEILRNKIIPLRRGYIAVVNRSQRDVNNNLSIREGLKKEEEYFKNHPLYGRNADLHSKCGIHHLSKALNGILMHNIRDCLPDLKTRITSMMSDVIQELEVLGKPTESRSTLGGTLLGLLSKFANNYGSIIEGRGGQSNIRNGKANPFTELFGGSRISYIFTEVFTASIMSVGAFDGLTDDEIRTTICNANGTRPALFVPEVSFDILIRRQIVRLEQPGLQCVDLVFEELQRIASQAEPTELVRFPTLHDRLAEVVSYLLKRSVGPSQMMVSNLVKIELAYINTSHPDFLGGSRAVARLMEKVGKENDEARRRGPVHDGSSIPSSKSSHEEITGEGKNEGEIMSVLFRGKKLVNARKDNNAGGILNLPTVPDTMKQTDVPPTERERVELEVIKSLIESYFAIVKKNFIDLVPKTIMYFLVNHVRDAMQNELVSELYRDAEIENLMQEAEDIAQRRLNCTEMSDLLGKAMEIVNEVRDFNSFQ